MIRRLVIHRGLGIWLKNRSTDTPESPEALVSTDQVADLQRERDDYQDRWMRKSAEFDNYRKRIERERREQADQKWSTCCSSCCSWSTISIVR